MGEDPNVFFLPQGPGVSFFWGGCDFDAFVYLGIRCLRLEIWTAFEMCTKSLSAEKVHRMQRFATVRDMPTTVLRRP